MKIATWNIERLKHKLEIERINSILLDLNADILVLTETDKRITLPNYKNCFQTNNLSEKDNKYYLETENRISIYTNYNFIKQFETFDKYTSLCIELETENGNLIVYGTIIGIYGNRNENFNKDLSQQINDIDKLSKESNFCLIGDYNISFSDNYYFTNFGREELNKTLDRNSLKLITRENKECIDHIAISNQYINSFQMEILEWNEDKKLSDHKGVVVKFNQS